MKLIHVSSTPWRTLSKGLDVFYLKATTSVTLKETPCLNTKLVQVVQAGPYSFLVLNEHAPCNPKKKYHFIKEIKSGVGVSAVLLVYIHQATIVVTITIFGMFHIWHSSRISRPSLQYFTLKWCKGSLLTSLGSIFSCKSCSPELHVCISIKISQETVHCQLERSFK